MFIDRDIQLTTSIFILDLVPVTVYEATKLSLEFMQLIRQSTNQRSNILVGTIAVYLTENNNVVLRT